MVWAATTVSGMVVSNQALNAEPGALFLLFGEFGDLLFICRAGDDSFASPFQVWLCCARCADRFGFACCYPVI